MNNINELQDYTLDDLFQAVNSKDDDEFDELLVSYGLLHGSTNCRSCGLPMKIDRSGHGSKIWQCNRRACRQGGRPKIGYKVGTIFNAAHATPKEVFKLAYFFARDYSGADAVYESKLGEQAVYFGTENSVKYAPDISTATL